MNIGKRTTWQVAAVTAAALFAGIAQAGDRGHSTRHDGHRDRHGWHDHGRYEKSWHDRGPRHETHYRGKDYGRGDGQSYSKHRWAPPRHRHHHQHNKSHGYSSSSWPYAVSGAQLIVSVPLY